MKNESRNLLAAIALLGIASFSANAQTRVGNGNGDGAFAIQQLAAQNPGLTPTEILQKAWDESKGRLVVPEQFIGREAVPVFLPNHIMWEIGRNDFGTLKAVGIYLGPSWDGHRESGPPFRWSDVVFWREVTDLGPLLPSRTVYFIGTDERQKQKLGLPEDADQTTVMKNEIGTLGGKYVELRQYTESVIVGIGYSHNYEFPKGFSGKYELRTQCAPTGVPTNNPAGTPCSIFYLWK